MSKMEVALAKQFKETVTPFEMWRRVVYDENLDLRRTIEQLQKRLDELDRHIGPSKRTAAGALSKTVLRKIEQRKKTHEHLQECEWRFHSCNRSLISLNACLNTAIVSHSCSITRTLMTKLYTLLPLTVRQRVYIYLLDDDAILERIDTQVHQQIQRGCCSSDASCIFDYTGIELLDPSFTQTEMSTEILSIAADLISHRETAEFAPKSIGLFLDMQALHLDVSVEKFFSNLKIELHLADLLSEWREKQLVAGGKESMTGVSTRFQAYLRALIEDVPAREERGLTVEVYMEGLSASEREVCRRVIESAVEVVKRRDYMMVEIVWHGRKK